MNERRNIFNEEDGRVRAVNLITGDRTVLADANVGTGPALGRPEGMAIDSANNRALVTDFDLEAILAVDLTTGDRTILSDDATGTGPKFGNTLTDLALDSGNNFALVTTSGPLNANFVLAVELGSGDRVIVSR